MKNKIIRNNIFKVSKIYLMFAIISSIINPVYSQELKEVKVKVECSGGVRTNNVELYCYGKNVSENAQFVDSVNPPNKRGGDCACFGNYDSKGWQCKYNVYKHTMSDGSVMYSESNSLTHFDKDDKCEGSFNPMDLLKAMPEIGISRVDPNLIEY